MTYPNTICSANTLAQLLKISSRRVRQLGELGIMHRIARGQYELFQSVEGYVKYLRQKKVSTVKDPKSYQEIIERLSTLEQAVMAINPKGL